MSLEQIHVSFPEAHSNASPTVLHETYYPLVEARKTGHHVYFSCPLTSGGGRRFLDPEKKVNPNIEDSITTIITINTAIAEYIAEEINPALTAHIITPDLKITLPHRIGSRMHNNKERWREYDYMRFWLYHLSGVTPHIANAFDTKLHYKKYINEELLNDYTADRDARLQEYTKLLNLYTEFLNKRHTQLNPVSLMIGLPDHNLSLGCTSERKIAHHLGIPFASVAADKNHPHYENFETNPIFLALAQSQSAYSDFVFPVVERDGRHLFVLDFFQ
jgi:hypothetical protein